MNESICNDKFKKLILSKFSVSRSKCMTLPNMVLEESFFTFDIHQKALNQTRKHVLVSLQEVSDINHLVFEVR